MDTKSEWVSDELDSYYSPEETILDVKSNYDIRRYNSAEGYSVVIDDITTQVIIQSHSNPLNEGKYDKKIHIPVESVVNTGSIVEWDSNYWIIVSNIDDLKAYKSASMVKSNNTLLFYTPLSNENPILYEIPCIVGNISIGNETNKYINTVDNTVPLTLPNNEITRQIKPTDTYKIGQNNYTISSVADDISVNGLLIFKLEYSESQQILPSYSLSILNGELIQVNENNPLTINAQVTDTTNNIILSSPELIFESSDVSIATIDSVTGVVSILGIGNVEFSCKWLFGNDVVVMDAISVEIVAEEQNNYTYSLVGNISPDTEVKSGQTKTFTAHKFNNGIEIIDAEFDFSILDNEAPNAYTFIILSDTQISLKANSYTFYIYLRATDISNGEYVEKQIKLRSIL